MTPRVSIIIVDYKSKKEIRNAVRSIKKSKPKTKYEVIIVDNNKNNIGFGAGCNMGAKKAEGKYLLFLNPDTLFENNAIDSLVNLIAKDKSLAVVAPLLLDPNKKPYQFQGTKNLNPLNAIFVLTFINKYFPNNYFSKKYWLKNWSKKANQEVDVVPGTAFMISKKTFSRVGGFDKNFFLYFEEVDLCRRVQSLGKKLLITPKAKVVHLWGKSTDKIPVVKKDKIFANSRRHYFKKHFGAIGELIAKIL